MTDRTSNKMIAAKLDTLIELLTAQAITAAPPATVVAASEPTGETSIDVDAQYLNHMVEKVGDWAKTKGEDVILYARKNVRGETKLAYCLASKWTTLKDKRLIGAVKHISHTE